MSRPLAPPSRPVVVTTHGAVRGVCSDGVVAFRGLPYAAPPVGPLRWRPPRPATPWIGERDAATWGAICVQSPPGADPGVGPPPMREDCLTLNVWAPESVRDLPVMLWIHGGGYHGGSGTASLYDGSALARLGVVVVTINYRLGRLGFFDHPALAAERPPDEPAANYGVMDQIAALGWVRDEIAAFGGDPGNVTVFGESAGGAAVLQLMVSPSARGLFHRAVVQSGFGRQASARLDQDLPGLPSVQTLGLAWARSAGLPEDVGADVLRAVAPERLLTPPPAFYTQALIVDGEIVPEDVEPAFRAGRQAPVPLILGANSAEFRGVRPADAGTYGHVEAHMTPPERAALIAACGGQGGYDAHVLGDLLFHEPARHLARLHARAGHPTFLYRFDVAPEGEGDPRAGAPHAAERPYVFQTLHAVDAPFGPRDHAVALDVAAYWTDFARVGDPNGGVRPAWPDFRRQPDHLLEFTRDGPRAAPIPDAARLDVIEAIYARLNA